MTACLIAAAALTFLIGVVHSWLGEVRLIGPLLAPGARSGLLARSGFARRVLRFAWHLTTVAWWYMAAVFVALASEPPGESGRLTLFILAATFLVTALVILISGRGRHFAWPVFAAIALLAVLPAL